MMRSMYTGVSGLRNHQIRLDVIGNNIANVNTVGFKRSRTTFQDIFYQTMRGASSPQGGRGGTNPIQVGLGMSVGSVDTIHSQGNLQTTGKMTDLAIQGSGFFILSDGDNTYFTRAGNFNRDQLGYLVNPSDGLRVQGWMASGGVFPALTEDNLTDIRIPIGETVGAKATTRIAYDQNLDAATTVGTGYLKPVQVFDSQGTTHTVTVTFTKTGANAWDWSAEVGGVPAGNGTITFDTDGRFLNQTGGPVVFDAGQAGNVTIDLDFSGVTQYAGSTTVQASERDGYPMGTLESFKIDANGVITGVYSNGQSQKLAQVALANFSNPGGLSKLGRNLYQESNNSGISQIGQAGTGGRGTIAPGSLEMSNVDLAKEFTDMIVTQRGFQANSRIITTSDEMLQELVNLKR